MHSNGDEDCQGVQLLFNDRQRSQPHRCAVQSCCIGPILHLWFIFMSRIIKAEGTSGMLRFTCFQYFFEQLFLPGSERSLQVAALPRCSAMFALLLMVHVAGQISNAWNSRSSR